MVGQYLGASRGIGYFIPQAEEVFSTTGMVAGLAVLAAGALLIGAIVNRLKRRLIAMEPHS